MPTSALIGGVSTAVVLVAFGGLLRYLQKRERRQMEILHRPNEAWLIEILDYVIWGCAGIATLATARVLLSDRDPWPLLGCGLLIVVGIELRQIRKRLQGVAEAWLSTRLRLTGITHRSVEFVLLTSPRDFGPIRAQAEYSRHTSWESERRESISELIWRSPTTSLEPVLRADRSEYRARIAIPDDFPRPLDAEMGMWRRRWHITVQGSPQRAMNFDFHVPQTVPPDA